MVRQTSLRAVALIVFVGFLTTIQSSNVPAQKRDDLETLRQQINQFDQAGKYAEALTLQRRLVAKIEKADTASAGKPGAKTARALNEVAWFALLTHNFKEALAASNRAHALAPNDLYIETNRAHALLFVGRTREARAIYLAYKNKPMSTNNTYMWQDAIAGDVDDFKKAGLEYVAVAKIASELGGQATQSGQALHDIAQKIQKLETASRLNDALPLAQQYVTLARQRYGEDQPEFATAIGWLGKIHYDKEDYPEAKRLMERALAIDEKALGPDHSDVARDLNNLALLYGAQRRSGDEPLLRPDEASPLAQQYVALARQRYGEDNAEFATAIGWLGQIYHDKDEDLKAQPLMERALAIDEKALGPDHPNVARDLNNLASLALLYDAPHRYAEAELPYKRALAIDEKAFGADHPDVGRDLNNLASLYRAEDRFAEAMPLYQRAIAIAEKVLGPDNPHVRDRVYGLAELCRFYGRYAEAEQLFKRVLAIDEKARPDDPEVARDLSNLAALYRVLGRYGEVEPLIEREMAIMEKAFGLDTPTGVLVQVMWYTTRGRDAEAEQLYQHVIAIKEKMLGPDHPDVGSVLNFLADFYRRHGRDAEAEPLYKRALAIDEKAFGPDNPNVRTSVSNLAELYFTERRYDEAEPLMKRAIALTEKRDGGPNYTTSLLNDLAALYTAQNRYAEAEQVYKRAIAIDEKALSPDDPGVGTDLNNLAELYVAQDRYAEAEALYKRVLAIDQKAHPGYVYAEASIDLNNLGALYVSEGDWARAVDSFRRGTAAIQFRTLNMAYGDWANAANYAFQPMNPRRTLRGTQSVGQAMTPRNERLRSSLTYSLAIKAASRLASEQRDDMGFLRRETFETAQWVLGSEASESLAQTAARGAKGDPRLEQLIRERQDLAAEWQKRDQMRKAAAEQTLDSRNRQTEAEGDARRNAIYDRIAKIDKELAAKFPDYARLVGPLPLPVDEVQKQLGADEALVLFLDTPEWKLTPEETFIWVVTKSDMRWVRSDLGTPALRREIPALRCGLDYEGSWADAHCSDLLKVTYTALDYGQGKPLPFDLARAYELYKGLFGQIEDVISDKRLLIVPSGPLTQLPFQVLVTKPPKVATPTSFADFKDVTWLARKHAITVLPAVSSLRALRQLAKESHASEAYIGFGNPLLDGEPEKFKEDGPAAKLAREKRCEPASRQRVASLLGLRGGTGAVTRGTDGTVNVADIRSWAPLPETADELCDVAHELDVDPKTHLYLGATATETKVKQLSEDGSLARYKIVHFATHGAVAGQVSHAAEPGLLLTPPEQASETDDGYLTASEIAGLKLDADWVILSACNTAAGGAQGAEALSGLARAFFYAGARSLLVSHWEVNSDSTVKLITKAVDELKRNPEIGRAEALRRSMLAMIDNGKDYEAHPAFWAPFVLVGEGGAAR